MILVLKLVVSNEFSRFRPSASASHRHQGAAMLPPENLLVRPEVRGLLEPEWPQLTTVGDFKQLDGGGFFVAKIEVPRWKFTNWP
jgi:hypothetical protein